MPQLVALQVDTQRRQVQQTCELRVASTGTTRIASTSARRHGARRKSCSRARTSDRQHKLAPSLREHAGSQSRRSACMRCSVAQCGLTPRSSGAPTAGHQARAGGTRYIFTSPGLASCRCRPLSSNVRPHKCTHSRKALKFSAAQLAFVQKALQCRDFVLALGRVQPSGSPSTATLLVTHGAVRARSVRAAAALLLGAVLNFGRAEQLNTSCA